MNQIVEVLTGAETEDIRKWGHERLSTYGIGQEHSRPEWKAIGRELIRLGLVRQHRRRSSACWGSRTRAWPCSSSASRSR